MVRQLTPHSIPIARGHPISGHHMVGLGMLRQCKRRRFLPDLLDLALNAHGGLDRWRQVQSLDVLVSLTGGLYRLKGYPDGVPNTLMHVETRHIAVDVSPWHGHSLALRSGPRLDHGRRAPGDRPTQRPSCLVRRPYPRDPLGPVAPALLHKLCSVELPKYAVSFYPTGFEVREIEPHQENGESWRCLWVKSP